MSKNKQCHNLSRFSSDAERKRCSSRIFFLGKNYDVYYFYHFFSSVLKLYNNFLSSIKLHILSKQYQENDRIGFYFKEEKNPADLFKSTTLCFGRMKKGARFLTLAYRSVDEICSFGEMLLFGQTNI